MSRGIHSERKYAVAASGGAPIAQLRRARGRRVQGRQYRESARRVAAYSWCGAGRCDAQHALLAAGDSNSWPRLGREVPNMISARLLTNNYAPLSHALTRC